MTRRNWLSLVGFGAFLVIAALLVGPFWPDSESRNSSKASAASGDGSEVSDAVVEALTVTSVPVEFCLDVVQLHGGSTVASGSQTVVSFKDKIGALKGTPPRLWSDALTVPYVQTEPVKMLEETQAEICFNPHYGATVANFFANMSVGDVKLVEINDWLTPFAGDAGQINAKAAEFILLDVTNPTDEQKKHAVKQNIAWQQVAGKLGTLLSRFQVDGVRAEQSTLNYHLVAGGASVGGLPEVGLNPNQENLPALVLKLTEKGACVPIKVIGFNVGDKRPEEFAPPVCEKPAPPTVQQPAPKPKPPSKAKPVPKTVPPKKGVPTTAPPKKDIPTTTTKPPVTTTTRPPGKQTPTTQAPPPTTAPPSSPPTTQPNNGGQGDSGDGATNTTSPPTTQAPAPAPPNSESPTTNPPPPPG